MIFFMTRSNHSVIPSIISFELSDGLTHTRIFIKDGRVWFALQLGKNSVPMISKDPKISKDLKVL